MSRTRTGLLPALLIPAAVTFGVAQLHMSNDAWPAYASLYLCAVAAVALALGWVAALVCLVLSALLLDYFYVGPVGSLSIPAGVDRFDFLSFVIAGVLVAACIGWRRSREHRMRIGVALRRAQVELAEARLADNLRETGTEAIELLKQKTQDIIERSETGNADELDPIGRQAHEISELLQSCRVRSDQAP